MKRNTLRAEAKAVSRRGRSRHLASFQGSFEGEPFGKRQSHEAGSECIKHLVDHLGNKSSVSKKYESRGRRWCRR